MKKGFALAPFVFLACIYHFTSVSVLSAQESFYRGKSIRLIVGSTPGGFYDRWRDSLPNTCPNIFPAIRK
jgi:hypothetical protein